MSEDITAVFSNGCPALPDNWLDEINRHTRALLVDLPPVTNFLDLYKSHARERQRKTIQKYILQHFANRWYQNTYTL
jgi:hypothetical protein